MQLRDGLSSVAPCTGESIVDDIFWDVLWQRKPWIQIAQRALTQVVKHFARWDVLTSAETGAEFIAPVLPPVSRGDESIDLDFPGRCAFVADVNAADVDAEGTHPAATVPGSIAAVTYPAAPVHARTEVGPTEGVSVRALVTSMHCPQLGAGCDVGFGQSSREGQVRALGVFDENQILLELEPSHHIVDCLGRWRGAFERAAALQLHCDPHVTRHLLVNCLQSWLKTGSSKFGNWVFELHRCDGRKSGGGEDPGTAG